MKKLIALCFFLSILASLKSAGTCDETCDSELLERYEDLLPECAQELCYNALCQRMINFLKKLRLFAKQNAGIKYTLGHYALNAFLATHQNTVPQKSMWFTKEDFFSKNEEIVLDKYINFVTQERKETKAPNEIEALCHALCLRFLGSRIPDPKILTEDPLDSGCIIL
ncbi:hypothetical protein K2X40_04820 [Candidatus Babeliales bacterium]|nr:hypothetical protein [Candidatus Babeliales bacterium]